MKTCFRSILFCLALAASVLLSGSGCVKIDATVIIDREGAGTLRAVYGMPSYIIKQADLARELSRSLDLAAGKTNAVPQSLDIPYLYDEALLKAKFAAMAKEGITVEALKLREQGGWKYVDFTLKFLTLESLFKQSFFNDCGVSLKRLDDKTCKLIITLPPVGNTPEAASVFTQESLNKLTPFFNGFRVVTRMIFPGEIRNSNSLISDTRRVTWEWDFDKDSQVLARLAQSKLIVVFDAAEARIMDFEKPVAVSPGDKK
ncbi:MAG: hypothetical protein WCI03_06445 [bacterium]|jgi:hypothetical protein